MLLCDIKGSESHLSQIQMIEVLSNHIIDFPFSFKHFENVIPKKVLKILGFRDLRRERESR
jgi:hypothetical protein